MTPCVDHRCGRWLVLLLILGCAKTTPPQQPIAYNHNLHVSELEIPCTDCHIGAEESDHATLPGKDICVECHEDDPLSDSPEEAKLIEMLAQPGPLPWVRVTRVAEHVHFSHRRHVKAGQLLCERCHGAIAEHTSPITRPAISFRREIGMQRCISCHEESGNSRATVDCTLCHR
jgi:Cytochrome c7 and related cytochrome c